MHVVAELLHPKCRRLEEIENKLSFKGAAQDQDSSQRPQEASHQIRKRAREVEGLLEPDPPEARRKRARILAHSIPVDDLKVSAAYPLSNVDRKPINYWSEHGRWPRECFEQDDQTRDYLKRDVEAEAWFEKYWPPDMSHLLARKRSATSLARKRSDSSSVPLSTNTPSDEKPRDAKSAPYTHASYTTVLATKGCFMDKSERGITVRSKAICISLLDNEQSVPLDSLFRDDLFDTTCRNLSDRNEGMIIRDIGHLIVPSAQTLATCGATHLKFLTEGVNEGWNSAIPFCGPRPQPDYSLGFGRSAFTDKQLEKLNPFVGDIMDTYTSFFMATWRMYFPFLTCEVKCGAAALDIADRQNAHSMTLAVRAIVELFRYVGRARELDREILAFSISHDHRAVRIYGHYAEIDGRDQKYYRHPIRMFDLTDLDGKEKWTAYKFVKNVYDIWMPKHFERLSKVIDQLPADADFELSQRSELNFTEWSELTPDLSASY